MGSAPVANSAKSCLFQEPTRRIPRDVRGMYVVILEMDGASPCIYIGSSIAFKGGVLYRTRSYWKRKNLPKNVKKFSGGGYYICLDSSRKFRDTLPRWYLLGLAAFVGDVGSDVYFWLGFTFRHSPKKLNLQVAPRLYPEGIRYA